MENDEREQLKQRILQSCGLPCGFSGDRFEAYLLGVKQAFDTVMAFFPEKIDGEEKTPATDD